MKTPTTFDGLVEQLTVEHPPTPFEHEADHVRGDRDIRLEHNASLYPAIGQDMDVILV